MRVTAYTDDEESCAPYNDGFTASGLPVTHNGGRFVAADTKRLPFGTMVKVPGYADGEAVPVIDRGGAIRGNRLDLFFPSRREALAWGVRWVDVEIVKRPSRASGRPEPVEGRSNT